MTLTQSTTTTYAVVLEAVDSRNSLAQIDELDKTIKSLAGYTLHDNVDWLVLGLAHDSGVTTKEGKDLGTVGSVWDLFLVNMRKSWGFHEAYVLDLDYAIVVRLCQSAVFGEGKVVRI